MDREMLLFDSATFSTDGEDRVLSDSRFLDER